MLCNLGSLKLSSIDPFDDIDSKPWNDDTDFLIGSNPLAIASDDPREAEYIKGLYAVNDGNNSDSDDQE